jgi:hypothetical protein
VAKAYVGSSPTGDTKGKVMDKDLKRLENKKKLLKALDTASEEEVLEAKKMIDDYLSSK